jgi:hypothetical protein
VTHKRLQLGCLILVRVFQKFGDSRDPPQI